MINLKLVLAALVVLVLVAIAMFAESRRETAVDPPGAMAAVVTSFSIPDGEGQSCKYSFDTEPTAPDECPPWTGACCYGKCAKSCPAAGLPKQPGLAGDKCSAKSGTIWPFSGCNNSAGICCDGKCATQCGKKCSAKSGTIWPFSGCDVSAGICCDGRCAKSC